MDGHQNVTVQRKEMNHISVPDAGDSGYSSSWCGRNPAVPTSEGAFKVPVGVPQGVPQTQENGHRLDLSQCLDRHRNQRLAIITLVMLIDSSLTFTFSSCGSTMNQAS